MSLAVVAAAADDDNLVETRVSRDHHWFIRQSNFRVPPSKAALTTIVWYHLLDHAHHIAIEDILIKGP